MYAHTITRCLALVVGIGMAATAAAVSVVATGGLGQPHAWMIIAVAAGVIAGSIVIGQSGWRWALVIGIALLAGEAYALLSTAERVIAARAAVSAPHVAQEARRTKAENRVDAAVQAKAEADAAAIAKAAEKACAKNCRVLLEGAKQDAANELRLAREALDALPAPTGEAAPLASRLGVEAWVVDLVSAALASIACNGLACALIAFASHAPATLRESRTVATQRAPAVQTEPSVTEGGRREQVARFCKVFRTEHGRDPTFSEVRAALNLPKATASKYLAMAKVG
jgi:hypothetical protein